MIIKGINLLHRRVGCLRPQVMRMSRESSQVAEVMRVTKEPARADPEPSNQVLEPNQIKTNSNTLTESQRQELSQVIKSPIEMDIYFETRLREIPLVRENKFFDPKGGISVDVLAVMHRKWDISWDGFKRKLRYYINMREIYNQRYIARRHAILGPELATAHFIVYRGGKVRFKNAPNKWIFDCNQMPNVYDSRYRLIAVDGSDLRLRYEALDNMITLDSLQELNLSKNKLLDDFACDKIARLFRNSKNLSVLDLSDNPLISHRGIEALHRIRSLKRLVISGTKAANDPFIELLVILFNDVNPNCEVIIK